MAKRRFLAWEDIRRSSTDPERPARIDARVREKLASMPERNIGQEILDGLRDIKAGKVGRVISWPPTSCPTPIEAQLATLARVADEDFPDYAPEALEWASAVLNRVVAALSLPVPYIYGTYEGNVQAEISAAS